MHITNPEPSAIPSHSSSRASRWARGAALAGATACLLAPASAFGQEPAVPVPVSSPPATLQQTVATTQIEVIYSRPSARGRQIYGGLVPWDEVWRTGADSATRITFSTPVTVEGQKLEAGSYELFTIPGKSSWTAIFQEHGDRWGSYAYSAESDVARVSVEPQKLSRPVETLTLGFRDLKPASAVLEIAWADVAVPLEIAIDVGETVVPSLEEALKEGDAGLAFRAALFYFESGLDLDRAVELVDRALEANPTHLGMLYRKALMLEKKGDVAGAIAAAKGSMASAAKVQSRELREEYKRLNETLIERLES
ncbi:MAG: DUF2911 domain-containing protein [Acidobacteriota bacterium]